MKVLIYILELITSPFHLIMRSDNFITHKKPIPFFILIFISLLITAGLILLVYRNYIFG